MDKEIVGWLKREHLNIHDVENILERLQEREVVEKFGRHEADDDAERNEYFARSYFVISLPVDFEQRIEQRESEATRIRFTGPTY